MDKEKDNEQVVKAQPSNIGCFTIFIWFVGLMCLLFGLITFLSFSIVNAISGFVLFVAGLTMLPPTRSIIEKKLNIKLSNGLSCVLVFVLFVVGIGIGSSPKKITDNTAKKQEKQVEIKSEQDQSKVAEVKKQQEEEFKNKQADEATKKKQEEENIKKSESEQKQEIIFDLKALQGKNIDEIVSILGEPVSSYEPTEMQISLGVKEGDKTYKKDNRDLLITYDISTRKVKDFFTPTDDPSGTTKNVENLKVILNVQDTTYYKVEPVNALGDPYLFTGLKVSPR
jgi:hypothetical protein